MFAEDTAGAGANLPAGQPLQLDTEIYGASLSKAVFAVLVMKLVEQGVIGLDTPLQQDLEEPLWKKASPGTKISLSISPGRTKTSHCRRES